MQIRPVISVNEQELQSGGSETKIDVLSRKIVYGVYNNYSKFSRLYFVTHIVKYKIKNPQTLHSISEIVLFNLNSLPQFKFNHRSNKLVFDFQ